MQQSQELDAYLPEGSAGGNAGKRGHQAKDQAGQDREAASALVEQFEAGPCHVRLLGGQL